MRRMRLLSYAIYKVLALSIVICDEVDGDENIEVRLGSAWSAQVTEKMLGIVPPNPVPSVQE